MPWDFRCAHRSPSVHGFCSLSWASANVAQRGDNLIPRGGLPSQFEGSSKRKNDERLGFLASLRACAKAKDLERGCQVHEDMLRRGLLDECSNALITMYAQCGALNKAKQLFDVLGNKDVFTWTALIGGCAQNGQDLDALTYFELMKQKDFCPDAVTYTCVLKACGNMGDLRRGETIHEDIATQGLLLQNIELGNALVSMYAKCGSVMKARQVLQHLPFRNTVSWSALIAGYVQQGEDENALNCFNQMLHEGHAPNSVTLMCILKACSNLRAVDRGEQIHLQLAKAGLPREDIMLATALVDMYAKSGAIAKAWQVLDEVPMWDTASWNALISGSLEQGEAEKAMEFFKQMDKKGLHPTSVTFICALKACGIMGALDEGKRIHDRIEKEGLLQTDIILGNALVDMYVKLGAVSAAHKVLKGLRVRDTISWNSFIAGLDMSHATYLLCCLEEMEADGISPNAATLSCVLSACCRSGLVDDAQLYFLTMTTKYCVKPDLEHFTCIIDLLGRAGHLDKAAELLKIIGTTDVKVWSTLLSACQRWGNVNVGRWVFEEALQVA